MVARGTGEPREGVPERRTPKRARTEARLLRAALDQIQRDGVLAGLNLQEVADAAGVNRGLIHTYFGSRQALLRAALSAAQAAGRETHQPFMRGRTPRDRGAWLWSNYPVEYAQMVMLLALDGAEDIEVLQDFEEELDKLEGEQAQGIWAEDVDLAALIVFYNVVTMGYFVLRDPIAAQLGLTERQLDVRVGRLLERMFAAVLATPAPATKGRRGQRLE